MRLSNSRPGVVSMSHPKNKEGVRSTYMSYVNKKKELLYKNKKLKFHEFIDELNKHCVICFDSMTSSKTLTHSCGNTFHATCIKKWMNHNTSCPLCKKSLTNGLSPHHIESNLCNINNYTPLDILQYL